jgi:hypothetical protein
MFYKSGPLWERKQLSTDDEYKNFFFQTWAEKLGLKREVWKVELIVFQNSFLKTLF